MKITEDQMKLIIKHEGVETEGLQRQLFWITISLCIGAVHAAIHYKLSILDLNALIITSITLSITVYAFIFTSDYLYMKLYRRYSLLKETAMQVVNSNRSEMSYGIELISDHIVNTPASNSSFSPHKSDTSTH